MKIPEVRKNVISDITVSEITAKNSAYRSPNNCNIYNFFNELSLILNKNLSIFDNIKESFQETKFPFLKGKS